MVLIWSHAQTTFLKAYHGSHFSCLPSVGHVRSDCNLLNFVIILHNLLMSQANVVFRCWRVIMILAALFLAFSVGQMYVWAIKKHKLYRREFPNYPKNRKAMFPFLA
jgi:hypothetical protein